LQKTTCKTRSDAHKTKQNKTITQQSKQNKTIKQQNKQKQIKKKVRTFLCPIMVLPFLIRHRYNLYGNDIIQEEKIHLLNIFSQ
jgi:ribosomal protein S19